MEFVLYVKVELIILFGKKIQNNSCGYFQLLFQKVMYIYYAFILNMLKCYL